MLAEPFAALRLNGSSGYGQGVFDPEDVTNVVKTLAEVKAYLLEHEGSAEALPSEAVDLVQSIWQHLQERSFPVNSNGHSKGWAEAQSIAQQIIEYGNQHGICGASARVGYEAAKNATLIAIQSGYVLEEVEAAVQDSGSLELRRWLSQLHDNERNELNAVIVKTATTFWTNLQQKGRSVLDDWLDRKNKQKRLLQSCKQLEHYESHHNGHRQYNGPHMGERLHPQPQASLLRDSDLTVEEVIAILTEFQQTLHSDQQQSPGRRPNRVERIIKEIQESDSTTITLAQLEERFSNTKNPRATASSYISWLKRALEENDARIDIEPQVIYQFRPASR
jgi:hypothetical protein